MSAACENYSHATIMEYRDLRNRFSPQYPTWTCGYLSLAENYGLEMGKEFASPYGIPHALERATHPECITAKPFVVICGPEGVGKTSIRRGLQQVGTAYIGNLTTRAKRPDEIDEEDGNIHISAEEFSQLSESGDLLCERNHKEGYKTGFANSPFLSMIETGSAFVMEKSTPSLRELIANLRSSHPDYLELFQGKMLLVVLLPNAPHILALRNMERTINYDTHQVTPDAQLENHLVADSTRALEWCAGLNDINQISREIPCVSFIVNDTCKRVVDIISRTMKE